MFKHKEYVLTIYNEGGFTAAAEKLFVSQPSLSTTVRKLEEKIGAPIFDRSTSPISLTEIGREYIEHARAIEECEANFARYLSDHSSLMTGVIRIGGTSFFSAFVLPGLISKFNEKYSGITFEIIEDSTKHLLGMLSRGDIDIVVDNALVYDEEILSIPYTRERLMLAVPRRLAVNSLPALAEIAMTAEDIKRGVHLLPFASRASHSKTMTGNEDFAQADNDGCADLSLFRDEPFVLLSRGNDTGSRAEAFFRELGISPNVVFRLDQQVTAYNLCASGMGVTFVSDTLIKQIGASPDILYYNLPEQHSERHIYFYTKKNRYQPIACRRFIELTTQ